TVEFFFIFMVLKRYLQFFYSCGEEFSSLRDLLNSNCYKHPNGSYSGSHQAYEGNKNNPFCCKYCGEEFRTLKDLLNSNCYKHPNGSYSGSHEPL
ncbi:MAG: hypothetical protein K2O68_02485, partial [Mucispirillum sp.]|nr:hypothetical protein [Mucispirillum sp.]